MLLFLDKLLMTNLIDSIRIELRKNSDPSYNVQRWFKEPIKSYNVRYPVVKKIARKFFPTCPECELIDACDALWSSGYQEEGSIAIQWVKKAKLYEFFMLETWVYKYLKNWAHIDELCCGVLGHLLIVKPEHIERVKSWTKSTNRWKRRAAAVSFIVPVRKGLYKEHMFEVASLLLKDNDDLVQKGYGWLLKEGCKKFQDEVFEFVMKNKKDMPRTALRYAIEKMPASLKKRAMEK